MASATSANTETDALLAVVARLTTELEHHAVGSRKARFSAIAREIAMLRKPAKTSAASWTTPLELSPSGWSLRRDDRRLILTSSLDAEGTTKVFTRAMSLLE